MSARIALVGDRRDEVVAHRAIPLALERARERAGLALAWEWLPTPAIGADAAPTLAGFAAIWCVPGSPYANVAGALAAVRFAREAKRAFLGTCGGFQHALLEHAASCWGVAQPAHAESEPDAVEPVIAALACSLVGVTGALRLAPGSRLAEIYGAAETEEAYHCSYGLHPRFAARLEHGPLRVAARDTAGELRAVERTDHPFFVATLFQPERAALAGRAHPLIAAFAAAACGGS